MEPPPRSQEERDSNTPVTNLLSTGPVIAALAAQNRDKKSPPDKFKHSPPPSSHQQDFHRNSPRSRGAPTTHKLSPREREHLKVSSRAREEERGNKYYSPDDERKRYYNKDRSPNRLLRDFSRSPSDRKDISHRLGDKVDRRKDSVHRRMGKSDSRLLSPNRERSDKAPLEKVEIRHNEEDRRIEERKDRHRNKEEKLVRDEKLKVVEDRLVNVEKRKLNDEKQSSSVSPTKGRKETTESVKENENQTKLDTKLSKAEEKEKKKLEKKKKKKDKKERRNSQLSESSQNDTGGGDDEPKKKKKKQEKKDKKEKSKETNTAVSSEMREVSIGAVKDDYFSSQSPRSKSPVTDSKSRPEKSQATHLQFSPSLLPEPSKWEREDDVGDQNSSVEFPKDASETNGDAETVVTTDVLRKAESALFHNRGKHGHVLLPRKVMVETQRHKEMEAFRHREEMEDALIEQENKEREAKRKIQSIQITISSKKETDIGRKKLATPELGATESPESGKNNAPDPVVSNSRCISPAEKTTPAPKEKESNESISASNKPVKSETYHSVETIVANFKQSDVETKINAKLELKEEKVLVSSKDCAVESADSVSDKKITAVDSVSGKKITAVDSKEEGLEEGELLDEDIPQAPSVESLHLQVKSQLKSSQELVQSTLNELKRDSTLGNPVTKLPLSADSALQASGSQTHPKSLYGKISPPSESHRYHPYEDSHLRSPPSGPSSVRSQGSHYHTIEGKFHCFVDDPKAPFVPMLGAGGALVPSQQLAEDVATTKKRKKRKRSVSSSSSSTSSSESSSSSDSDDDSEEEKKKKKKRKKSKKKKRKAAKTSDDEAEGKSSKKKKKKDKKKKKKKKKSKE